MADESAAGSGSSTFRKVSIPSPFETVALDPDEVYKLGDLGYHSVSGPTALQLLRTPGGRPKGSRNKLGAAFITALHADWQQHGPGAIERVRTEQPAEYLKIIARLVPQKFEVEQHEFSDGDIREQILEILRGIAADPELGPAAATIFAASPQPLRI